MPIFLVAIAVEAPLGISWCTELQIRRLVAWNAAEESFGVEKVPFFLISFDVSLVMKVT